MLPIPQNLLALDIRGTLKVTIPTPIPTVEKWVFQKTTEASANYHTPNGSPRMIRAHRIPFDPKTPAQLTRRALLAAAVAEWHTFSAAQKAAWKTKAKKRKITGFNAHISNRLTV